MKPLIQTSKVLRTAFGLFFTTMLVAVAALTLNRQVQADPGQGAVVTHISPDVTGHHYEAFSPDGQLKLDVALSGRGDFYRKNPDGTWTLQSAEPRAIITLSVPGGDGNWVPLWVGSGSFHITGLIVFTGDHTFDFIGEAYLHVEAKLTNVLDGSEWSFLVAAVLQDQVFKELKVELQPR